MRENINEYTNLSGTMSLYQFWVQRYVSTIEKCDSSTACSFLRQRAYARRASFSLVLQAPVQQIDCSDRMSSAPTFTPPAGFIDPYLAMKSELDMNTRLLSVAAPALQAEAILVMCSPTTATPEIAPEPAEIYILVGHNVQSQSQSLRRRLAQSAPAGAKHWVFNLRDPLDLC